MADLTMRECAKLGIDHALTLWSRDGRHAVSFAEALDLVTMLRALADKIVEEINESKAEDARRLPPVHDEEGWPARSEARRRGR